MILRDSVEAVLELEALFFQIAQHRIAGLVPARYRKCLGCLLGNAMLDQSARIEHEAVELLLKVSQSDRSNLLIRTAARSPSIGSAVEPSRAIRNVIASGAAASLGGLHFGISFAFGVIVISH